MGFIDSGNDSICYREDAWCPANPRCVGPVNYIQVPLSAVEASDFTVGALFRQRAEAYESSGRS